MHVEIRKTKSQVHNVVLRDLLESLYKKGYNILWYDHINLDIRKLSHPVTLKNKKYDIVAQIDDYLIFIELKTKKIDKKLREVILEYGGS